MSFPWAGTGPPSHLRTTRGPPASCTLSTQHPLWVLPMLTPGARDAQARARCGPGSHTKRA